VMPGVSRRSNQYLNWMWSVHRSSDSSRQCHGEAKNTEERLSGLAPNLRQSCGKPARAQLRRAVYAYTGTVNNWYEDARIHMQICKSTSLDVVLCYLIIAQ